MIMTFLFALINSAVLLTVLRGAFVNPTERLRVMNVLK